MKLKILILFLLFNLISTVIIGQTEDEMMNLPGTKLMSDADVEGIRSRMLEGMLTYFKNEISVVQSGRTDSWHYDFTSTENYEKSIKPNRERFRQITGMADDRLVCESLVLHETTSLRSLVAEAPGYRVYSVSWPVLQGVTGTGLWVEPLKEPVAQVVVIPDADHSPEMILGLSPGLPDEYQYARPFAEAGCRLLIPVIIDRRSAWSGKPGVAMTNQPHREYIYRRAYELGRHIIGYEVQKVLGAAEWFKSDRPDLPVLVAGYGEGGLLALYCGAVDTRIDGILVSGYFDSREGLWEEPVYRNVWSLLKEFGDAEIAGMIAPRLLVVEASAGPKSDGPPEPLAGQRDVAAPGKLKTPELVSVRREASKAAKIFSQLGVPERFKLVDSLQGSGPPMTDSSVNMLLKGSGVKVNDITRVKRYHLTDNRKTFDSELRMKGEIDELIFHMDQVIARSSEERKRFWEKADDSGSESWESTTGYYRDYFWEELTGRMPDPTENFNARSRKRFETEKWTSYWIELDVWKGITAGGILLVPKNIQEGERRPVVVFQHGLGGHPEPLTDPGIKSVYYAFGSKLADEGYIVYAPQNSYGLSLDEPSNRKSFRLVQRMANPLEQSIFSITIGQHDQTLGWLKQLPVVDSARIGFYGLSYGGKSAMRIPSVLKDYKIVICSGDFTDWVWKITTLDFAASYMFVAEYEIFEFNLANTFNYADMAGLIAPRPFMVERGHWDGVSPDEQVAHEYAKVRRLYVKLGIGDRTEIEFFDGGHEIHGTGTLNFLNKYFK